jgi:hypothetical protein
VIVEYDATNHGILSEEQLVASMGRLVAAGLLEAEGERLRATGAGRRLLGRSGRWWWPSLRRVDPLFRALRAVELSDPVVAVSLPEGWYERALRKYRGT